jgi:hypothetical protein
MPRLHIRQTGRQLLAASYRHFADYMNRAIMRVLDILMPPIRTWPNARQKAIMIAFCVLYVGAHLYLRIIAGLAQGTLNILSLIAYKISHRLLVFSIGLNHLSHRLSHNSVHLE